MSGPVVCAISLMFSFLNKLRGQHIWSNMFSKSTNPFYLLKFIRAKNTFTLSDVRVSVDANQIFHFKVEFPIFVPKEKKVKCRRVHFLGKTVSMLHVHSTCKMIKEIQLINLYW